MQTIIKAFKNVSVVQMTFSFKTLVSTLNRFVLKLDNMLNILANACVGPIQ